jgi:hypothetical protein
MTTAPLEVRNITAKKGPIDNTYRAGLNRAVVEVYARSLAQAKQRAIEHFKPSKKDLSLLWVLLKGG